MRYINAQSALPANLQILWHITLGHSALNAKNSLCIYIYIVIFLVYIVICYIFIFFFNRMHHHRHNKFLVCVKSYLAIKLILILILILTTQLSESADCCFVQYNLLPCNWGVWLSYVMVTSPDARLSLWL